jgi:hypothetical protein
LKCDEKHPQLVGKVAGCINKFGYVQIRYGDKTYKAHRLAWYFVNGEFPDGLIDHINQNKTDNRISNLRATTGTVNNLNSDVTDAASKMRGVHVKRKKFKNGKVFEYYAASIGINGKQKYLGYFTDAQKAHEAYKLYREKLIAV